MYQKTKIRREQMIKLINERRFLTVEELSEIYEVSIASIRRDLMALYEEGNIDRTHGGAVAKAAVSPLITPVVSPSALSLPFPSSAALADQIDALILTVVDAPVDTALVESFRRKNRPVIAESQAANLDIPVVQINNYAAGFDIGVWAGQYAGQHWQGKAHVLDLTYHLPNTQERSRGFWDGMRSVLPRAEEVLKLNSQSNASIAYRLTHDALTAYPHINIIFAINDTNALGAYRACQELKIPAEDIMILPFGLEGPTFRSLLQQNDYVKAGVAMFPEIVGCTCLLAALQAAAGKKMDPQLITPYAVLTAETLGDYYQKTGQGWEFCWDRIRANCELPIDLEQPAHIGELTDRQLRVGFVVRYRAHEWYQSLIGVMKSVAEKHQVVLEIVDSDQTIRHELSQRRREIAREAVKQVRSGSVILLDGGPITRDFAQQLANAQNLSGLRVITNSLEAITILQGSPNVTVVCTGGVLRRDRPVMVGPTAEGSLQNLRADQMFLMVGGISPAFGLSHDDMSEVSIKQAMMRAAREVVLLADHTCFGKESFVHFAPIKSVNRIITDETLQGSFRLEMAKLDIEVLVAG
jgi:DeoR family transcriptional regulator, fructose operon transcriptional repressor